MNVVIIDDESAARSFLSKLIQTYLPQLNLIDTASSAIEGIQLLKKHDDIDLIFLDIEMPGGTGFDFLSAIDAKQYKIVFTTAHAEFAIKAINLNANGYLLKPIDIDDLEELITMLKENKVPEITTISQQKIALKTQTYIEYVNVSDIIRAESEGSYTTVYLNNGNKIMVSKSLKQIESQINASTFIKPHKSHLVNINYVKRFFKTDGGYLELHDSSSIPVSRRKKEDILESLEKYIHRK